MMTLNDVRALRARNIAKEGRAGPYLDARSLSALIDWHLTIENEFEKAALQPKGQTNDRPDRT
jgi:hypothetical protein